MGIKERKWGEAGISPRPKKSEYPACVLMKLTNQKFLEKIDRGESFSPDEIFLICIGEVGTTITVKDNDGEPDEVDRYFTVNNRYFMITYMDDYDDYGRVICGRFDESEPLELSLEEFKDLVR